MTQGDGEPIFRSDDGRFTPTGHARGPWDPAAQHGGAPAALLAEHLQAIAGDKAIVRLTFEFLGQVPMAPLEVELSVLRPGRRFALLEGRIAAAGRTVVLVRAVALARGEIELPALARADAAPPAEGPGDAQPRPFPTAGGASDEGFHLTGMQLRFADATDYAPGPARTWFRMARPLVDDRPPCPLARVCAAADFGNGVSRVLDFDTRLFVNTDLTVAVLREPVGEWVLLDAATVVEPTGVGWAASALHDERGPIGHAQQTLFVAPR